MNIIDADEAADSLRNAVNDNIRESAKRQHLINKGYLDPRTLEKADEEAHPERGEQWEEQRSYRDRLRDSLGAPVGEAFAELAEQVEAKFGMAAALIEGLQERVAELEKNSWRVEKVSVVVPSKEELEGKPKRGKAKKEVEEV